MSVGIAILLLGFGLLSFGLVFFLSSKGNLERTLKEELVRNREEASHGGKQLREEISHSLGKLTEVTEKKLEGFRLSIEERLEQMRVTVDEKLQGTLEKRLGESFRLVSERLELVHRGLGEMQSLATGVGDLKKVLMNVKTRGTWGEVQLSALLEQILSPEQFERNVETKSGSGAYVEFAVKLPGRDLDPNARAWLPIDSKFPQEDYLRLVEAEDRVDLDAAETAKKQLEIQIKLAAKEIAEKYLNPPETIDFGIMFLPTEGLYAEVLKRPGLADFLQRNYRIVISGPTTLAAILNSIQMGFRSVAIERRSSEVWKILGAVKTEFIKFGEVLDKVHKKLGEASDTIETAARKSRTIERKLRGVEELTSSSAPPGSTNLIELDAENSV